MADDASADKFSYTGPTPADQQMDLTGDAQLRRRADIMSKSRMLTVPPSAGGSYSHKGPAGDKRTPMDMEVERLMEADQPLNATVSPLDVLGPGVGVRVARAAPSLVGAIARSMGNATGAGKPAALPESTHYGPLYTDAARSDAEYIRDSLAWLRGERGYNAGEMSAARDSLVRNGYTVDELRSLIPNLNRHGYRP